MILILLGYRLTLSGIVYTNMSTSWFLLLSPILQPYLGIQKSPPYASKTFMWWEGYSLRPAYLPHVSVAHCVKVKHILLLELNPGSFMSGLSSLRHDWHQRKGFFLGFYVFSLCFSGCICVYMCDSMHACMCTACGGQMTILGTSLRCWTCFFWN